ncbi:MAG: hypothetical protein IPN30_09605 [Flavobacteriales bacterium]|nr:hypothetical protein [Flavobacteriales bacterium]
MALNNGQKLRPLVGAEQVVQQDLVPFMRNEGFSSVRQANVPAMATGDQGGIHPLWSFAPTRKGCFANASEWKKQNGTKVLAVPYRFAFSSDGVLNLGYFISLFSDRYGELHSGEGRPAARLGRHPLQPEGLLRLQREQAAADTTALGGAQYPHA